MKINLGCGKKILEGYVNVDCVSWNMVDKVFDLDNYPWPFKNDSADEFYCDNVLEHLDYHKAIKEIHRILKIWGQVTIKVPYFSNPGAFFADHKCFFNYDSYNKFCVNIDSWMDLQEPLFELISRRITFLDEYKSGFIYKLIYFFPKLVYKLSPRVYIWFFSYTFPASELHFILRKI